MYTVYIYNVADIAPSHTGQHGGPLGVIPALVARPMCEQIDA